MPERTLGTQGLEEIETVMVGPCDGRPAMSRLRGGLGKTG